MSVRRFVRVLFGREHVRPHPPNLGDDLAEEVRETIGPVAGSGMASRLSGSAIYRYLENRKRRP